MIAHLGIQDFGLFVLTGTVLNLTPGADTLLVVSRSAAGGWRAGAVASMGTALGCMVHAVAAALGVAALLAASELAFRVLTWAGAGYLAYLGVQMLRQGVRRTAETAVKGHDAAPAETREGVLKRSFMQGLLTNLLNAKVSLFFLAFVPQFIRADAASPLASFIALGLVFTLSGVLWLLVVAALTVRWRGSVSSAAARWLNGLGGLLFLVLAWRLAFDRRSV
jgi:threonine/homoserine/homoserine lactone efflux protein